MEKAVLLIGRVNSRLRICCFGPGLRGLPVKDRCYSADPKNAKMLLFVSARKATLHCCSRCCSFCPPDKCHNVKRVAAELNISRPRVIYSWLYNRYKEPRRTSMHIPEYKVHPDNPKLKALYRCFEMGEPVILVAEEMNINRSQIYRWRISYLQRGYTSLMSKQEKKPASQSEMEKEIADLRKQLAEVQFQLDVMNETFKVLKKDQGVNPKTLTNQEKRSLRETALSYQKRSSGV